MTGFASHARLSACWSARTSTSIFQRPSWSTWTRRHLPRNRGVGPRGPGRRLPRRPPRWSTSTRTPLSRNRGLVRADQGAVFRWTVPDRVYEATAVSLIPSARTTLSTVSNRGLAPAVSALRRRSCLSPESLATRAMPRAARCRRGPR